MNGGVETFIFMDCVYLSVLQEGIWWLGNVETQESSAFPVQVEPQNLDQVSIEKGMLERLQQTWYGSFNLI